MKTRLSLREEEIMQVLWRLKKAFAKEVIAELRDPKPPYNTVSSILRKLQAESKVGYKAFGKTHQYYPILKKYIYRKALFKDFLSNYFSSSPEQFLSYFMKEGNLDPEEIEDILNQLTHKEHD